MVDHVTSQYLSVTVNANCVRQETRPKRIFLLPHHGQDVTTEKGLIDEEGDGD
jgi:pyridoxine 5'-phosphate synthase PdxJ